MKKLKLSNLEHSVINSDLMGKVTGGEPCGTENCCCACAYANSGGSSVANNCSANDAGGLISPGKECTSMD